MLAGVLALNGCKQSTNQGRQPAHSMPGAQSQPALPRRRGHQRGSGDERSIAKRTQPRREPGGGQQCGAAGCRALAPRLPRWRSRLGPGCGCYLDQSLGSKISRAGEPFGATVADAVVVDGATVIPRQARAEGKVIEAKARGTIQGQSAAGDPAGRVRTESGQLSGFHQHHGKIIAGKGRRTAKFAAGGGASGRTDRRAGRRRKGCADRRSRRSRRRRRRECLHGQPPDRAACGHPAQIPPGAPGAVDAGITNTRTGGSSPVSPARSVRF